MIIDFLLLLTVIGILIAAAVFDKQRRAIPKALNIVVFVLAAAGMIYQNLYYQLQFWVPSAIALGVWILLHIVNIILTKTGHKRLIGGADLNVYLCVSLCIPVLCNLWTAVWLLPVTIIFTAFGRLIPATEKDCKERGTPLLYFMLIGFLFMLIMHCLLYGWTFF